MRRWPTLVITVLLAAAYVPALGGPVAYAADPGPGDTNEELYSTVIESERDAIYQQLNGWLTRYRIEAVFSPATESTNATITGSLNLLYVNTTGAPQPDLFLRLYPNNDEYADGGMSIDSAQAGALRLDVELSEADTLAIVPLPAPVATEEAVELTVDFTTTIPTDPARSYGMFSLDRSTGTYALAHWLPLLAGFDPVSGWVIGPVSQNGDPVFTNTALFDVTLDVPADLTFVTTGDEVDTQEHGDVVTRRFISGPSRDFVMAADADFKVVSETVGDTVVNSFFNPGNEAGGQDVLTAGTQSFEIFNELFGTYPFKQMDLIEIALGNGAGGVEFPQLMYIGSDYYGASEFSDAIPEFLEFVTAHEVGHQWWYALVGNNQYQHAFIDEGLTNYVTTAYYGKQYGAEAARRQINTNLKAGYFSLLFNGGDQIVDQPTDDFPSMTSYGVTVYGKAALAFLELRILIGDDAFFGALQAYYQEFRFSVATPDDLKAAFETAYGQSLEEFWRHWFEAAEGREDYDAADLAELLREIGG